MFPRPSPSPAGASGAGPEIVQLYPTDQLAVAVEARTHLYRTLIPLLKKSTGWAAHPRVWACMSRYVARPSIARRCARSGRMTPLQCGRRVPRWATAHRRPRRSCCQRLLQPALRSGQPLDIGHERPDSRPAFDTWSLTWLVPTRGPQQAEVCGGCAPSVWTIAERIADCLAGEKADHLLDGADWNVDHDNQGELELSNGGGCEAGRRRSDRAERPERR